MSRLSAGNFPHPVLYSGNDDYVGGTSFKTTISPESIQIDERSISLTVDYELVCETLEQLVGSGDAAVCVHARCNAASYSEVFEYPRDSKTLTITVPKFGVVDKIEIAGCVLAGHYFRQYQSEQFNTDIFGTTAFDLRKGDLLAIEDPHQLYLDDSELERPVSSIFTIMNELEQVEPLIPSFGNHKVEVHLSAETYKHYMTLKNYGGGMLKRFINAVIILPVLTEAISLMRSNPDGYSDLRWYRVCVRKAKERGIDISDENVSLASIADALLGGITLDALKRYEESFESELNSGDIQEMGGVD